MKPIRVVVSGSRDWTDAETVHQALALFLPAGPLLIAHGCADGADMIADRWVRGAKARDWQVDVDRWPADWKQGKSAGVRRNLAMLKPGADAVLVFLLPCANAKCAKPKRHGSHGATHCGEHAEGLGIPTQWIDPQGVRR